eukprot:1575182-Rhodomonas_salina.2
MSIRVSHGNVVPTLGCGTDFAPDVGPYEPRGPRCRARPPTSYALPTNSQQTPDKLPYLLQTPYKLPPISYKLPTKFPLSPTNSLRNSLQTPYGMSGTDLGAVRYRPGRGPGGGLCWLCLPRRPAPRDPPLATPPCDPPLATLSCGPLLRPPLATLPGLLS